MITSRSGTGGASGWLSAAGLDPTPDCQLARRRQADAVVHALVRCPSLAAAVTTPARLRFDHLCIADAGNGADLAPAIHAASHGR